jgi:ribulose 1,5-bisphosphate synthetase/thiazole synthase
MTFTRTVRESMEVPIVDEYDVIVAGSGPGGLGAALAAARLKARVLLIEQKNYLGGLMASGLPLLSFFNAAGRRVVRGIPEEFVRNLQQLGGASEHVLCPKHTSIVTLDPELVKYVALQMAQEAGVDILLHTMAARPIVDQGQVKGVIIENKSGRQAVMAKIVIDATGDADLAYRAGVPHEKGGPVNELQPMTLMFRMHGVNIDEFRQYILDNPHEINDIGRPHTRPFPMEYFVQAPQFIAVGFEHSLRKAQENGDVVPDLGYLIVITHPYEGQVSINSAKVFGYDGTDAKSLTEAENDARLKVLSLARFFVKYIPGFADAQLIHTADYIGVRETRRIIGEYTLTKDDVFEGRIFDDTIALGSYPVDIHQQDGTRSVFIDIGAEAYGIPYRSLVPLTIENLLVAGRPISVSWEAFGSTRVMPICMAVGQAAGVAAVQAIQSGVSPRQLDAKTLRETLVSQGAMVDL